MSHFIIPVLTHHEETPFKITILNLNIADFALEQVTRRWFS